MSSVFGVPLSVNATMTAYRLMIQRVTKVAQVNKTVCPVGLGQSFD
jgi:uncharacterized protein YaaW (UPF0174 family)